MYEAPRTTTRRGMICRFMTTAHERTEVTEKPCLELADEIAACHVLHVAVCYAPENERAPHFMERAEKKG